MNHQYRVIYNETTHTYVAVPEFAKAQGKSSSATVASTDKPAKKTVLKSTKFALTALAGLLVISQPAFAADPENYFHVNPSTTNVPASGSNNKDSVSGIGSATGGEALAAGVDAVAEGRSSIAIGKNARVNNLGGIAIGESATAVTPDTDNQTKAIAIGGQAKATHDKTVAIGDLAEASGDHSFAMGAQAKSNEKYTTAVGSNSEATAQFGTAIGKSAKSTGDFGTAIGTDTKSVGHNSTAIGRAANSTGTGSMALGWNATTNANNAIAAGTNASATGASAIALGNASSSSGANSVAVGWQAASTKANAISFGREAKTDSDYSVAIGSNSSVTTGLNGAVALGYNSVATNSMPTNQATVGGITYLGFAGNNPDAGDVVSVGAGNRKRQIQNVAAGRISGTSTDAINGSQLYLTQEVLDNVAQTTATNFGGGVTVGTDGKLTAPTYTLNTADNTVAGTTATTNNVGDALSNLNTYVNAGFNVRDNAGAIQGTVTPTESIQFINGTGTTSQVTKEANGVTKIQYDVNVDSNTITTKTVTNPDGTTSTQIAANTTPLTNNSTTGKVDTPTQPDSLVTAQTVANAINNAGFTVKSAGNKATGDEVDSKLIKTGDEVVFEAGDNLTVKRVGNQFTFATAKDVKFDSVQFGDTGPKITNNDGNINIAGNDGSPTKITGVKAGENDTDAVNVSQLKAAQAKSTTEVKGTGLATVSKSTDGTDGHTIYTVDVAKANAPTVTRGNVTVQNGDENKVMTAGDVAKAINDSERTSSVVAGSNAVTVQAGAEDANGNTQYTVDVATDDTITRDAGGKLSVNTDGTTITTDPTTGAVKANTTPLTNATDGKVNTPTAPTALATAGDIANAINNSGWNLAADGTTGTELINPSDTVTFKAGSSNLTVKRDGANITYDLAKDININSVQFGDTGPKITNNGGNINIAGNDGSPTKITGVKAGENDTDAVNVSQLKAAQAKSTTEVKGTGLATVSKSTDGTDGHTIYTVDVAKANAPTVTRGNVTVQNGDENKVMTAGDVAKAINDSERTSSVVAGSNAVTVQAGTEDANGNTQYTVDVATDNTITRDAGGKLSVNTGSSLKVDGTTGAINVKTDDVTITTDPTTGAVKANTTPLTNAADGKVNTPATPTALATAGDIATAINNSGFTLTTSQSAGTASGTSAELINPGEKVTIDAGKNIAITQSGNQVSIATAKNVEFDSVTVPTSNGNSVTINNNGINAGGNKITNVAAGVANTDAVNVSQLNDAINNINTTIAGNNKLIGGNENTTQNVTGADGQVMGKPKPITVKEALTTYDAVGVGTVTSNSVVSAVYNINEQGTKYFHVNSGEASLGGTRSTNPEQSQANGAKAVAIGYKTIAGGNDSIAIGHEAQAIGAQSISIGTRNQVSGNHSGAIGDPTIVDADNSYSIGNNNSLTKTPQNFSDMFAFGNNITKTTDNSVFLGTQSGTFDQAGSTRDTQTGVHQAQGNPASAYTYNMENDANVAGVNNAKGIVSVGNDEETRQIQGVAAGVVSPTSTDAINGSQLYYTNEAINNHVTNINNNINQLGKRIDDVSDNADAGTAAAMATAGLPQAYLPGKSMIAVAGSTYRGKQGYAVGFSAITDGGNWIVKGSLNGNSRGHFGATVGAGYQW